MVGAISTVGTAMVTKRTRMLASPRHLTALATISCFLSSNGPKALLGIREHCNVAGQRDHPGGTVVQIASKPQGNPDHADV